MNAIIIIIINMDTINNYFTVYQVRIIIINNVYKVINKMYTL